MSIVTTAETWQQAQEVRSPLLQVQWWDTMRRSLGPRRRWLSGLSRWANTTVTVWKFFLSLQLLWVGGRSAFTIVMLPSGKAPPNFSMSQPRGSVASFAM